MILKRNTFALLGLAVVAVLLWLFNPWQENDRSWQITPTYHNVYQDSLRQEWLQLQQTLDPGNDPLVLNQFRLDYAPNGDVQQLFWSIYQPHHNGTMTSYSITRMPEMKQYDVVKNTAKDGHTYYDHISLDMFNAMLNPDVIHTMTPDAKPAYFSLQFDASRIQSPQQLPDNDIELQGARMIGPAKQQKDFYDGYAVGVMSMQANSDGSFSGQNPNNYYLTAPKDSN